MYLYSLSELVSCGLTILLQRAKDHVTKKPVSDMRSLLGCWSGPSKVIPKHAV